jgi:hypothetical protein
MFARARHMWTELRRWPTGRRFRRFHRDHAHHRTGWARCLTWIVALVSLAIGVVLMFIPGPAVVFFALTCALLATQSRWMARWLDRSEFRLRAVWRRYRRRRGPQAEPRSRSAAASSSRQHTGQPHAHARPRH